MKHHVHEHKGSLANALFDSYVDWRDECFAVHAAYERWRRAEKDDSAVAFAAYSAALDQEERACNLYAEMVLRVARTAPQAA